jgi:hypothetical protein
MRRRFKPLPKYQPCKPCWELKYCPYGPLVETSPLLSGEKIDLQYINAMHERALVAIQDARSREEKIRAAEFVFYSEPSQWERLLDYDPDLISCNFFGHVCPVFIMAEPFTETRDGRRSGRKIPRDIMLKVVRRDNYRCQDCGANVPDHELEFDHVIPYSRGGPTTVENLRLLCRTCNRKKSNSLRQILGVEPRKFRPAPPKAGKRKDR